MPGHDVKARYYLHRNYGPFSRVCDLVSAHAGNRSLIEMTPGQASLRISQADPAVREDRPRIGDLLAITSDVFTAPWVGPVTVVNEVNDEGAIAIEALEWSAALAVRPLPLAESWSEGSSGAVFASVMRDINTGGHTGLYIDADYEPGPAINNADIGGQTADQALADLHSKSDFEWGVDYDVQPSGIVATMRWNRQQGIDKSATVHWIEGRDFVKRSRMKDISHVRQVVTVIGGTGFIGSRTAISKTAGTAPWAAVLGTAMQAADQDLAEFIDVPPMLRSGQVVIQRSDSSPETLAAVAEQTLERLIGEADKFTVTLNGRPSWDVRPGDYVTVTLSRRGFGTETKRVRINALQPDEELGELDAVLYVPVR